MSERAWPERVPAMLSGRRARRLAARTLLGVACCGVAAGASCQLTAAWLSPENDSSQAVAWGDWDGDGDLDLAVGNSYEPARIYENVGGTWSWPGPVRSLPGSLTS